MTNLSIITPIYNCFEKIDNLIQCLNQQTDKNFEWIVIDDCSNDCDEFALQNKIALNPFINTKFIKNSTNSGAAFSRNKGIELSKSKYVVFVDSDDTVTPDFVESINAGTISDVDCLFFDYFRIRKNKKQRCKTLKCLANSSSIKKEDVLMSMTTNVCGKVFKKKVIIENNISFPDLRRYEDMCFNVLAVLNSNSFNYVDECLYNYIDNPTSVVNRFKEDSYKYALESIGIFKNTLLMFNSDIYELFIVREVLYTFLKEKAKTLSNKQLKKQSRDIFNTKASKISLFNYVSTHQKIILILHDMNLHCLIKFINRILGN